MADNIANSNAEHLNFMRTVGAMFQTEAGEAMQKALAMQVNSDIDLKAELAATPATQDQKQRKIDKRLEEHNVRKTEKTESVLVAVEEAANEFTQKDRHPEFNSNDLVSLKQLVMEIKPPITKEKILKVVGEKYPNPGMLDSALEFLEITNQGSPEILKAVKELREENFKNNREAVVASRNLDISKDLYEYEHEHKLGTYEENNALHMQVLTEAPQAPQLLLILYEKYKTQEGVELGIKLLNSTIGKSLRPKEGTDPSSLSGIDSALLAALMGELDRLKQISGIEKFMVGSNRLGLVRSKLDEAGLAA